MRLAGVDERAAQAAILALIEPSPYCTGSFTGGVTVSVIAESMAGGRCEGLQRAMGRGIDTERSSS